MENQQLLKQLLENTEELCKEHGFIIESEDDLYYYLRIFFGVKDPRYNTELTPEEEDLRLIFKHQGM